MVDVIDKHFEVAIINMFKELKKKKRALKRKGKCDDNGSANREYQQRDRNIYTYIYPNRKFTITEIKIH